MEVDTPKPGQSIEISVPNEDPTLAIHVTAHELGYTKQIEDFQVLLWTIAPCFKVMKSSTAMAIMSALMLEKNIIFAMTELPSNEASRNLGMLATIVLVHKQHMSLT
jgi:hypothetical protein